MKVENRSAASFDGVAALFGVGFVFVLATIKAGWSGRLAMASLLEQLGLCRLAVIF